MNTLSDSIIFIKEIEFVIKNLSIRKTELDDF